MKLSSSLKVALLTTHMGMGGIACQSGSPPDASLDPDALSAPDTSADSASETSLAFDAGGGICTRYGEPSAVGTVMNTEVQECSGLVASRDHAGVYWVHNDSGDTARIFAMNLEGTHLMELGLPEASHVDWEDIAIESRPDADWLYVGDIGDNAQARGELQVYRFPEPALDPTGVPHSGSPPIVERIRLRYPEAGRYNAESLAIDPPTGDLFILTKDNGGASRLFRLAGPISAPEEIQTLEFVEELQVNREGVITTHATSMDISPSGDRILVRTYFEVVQWARPRASTIAEAISQPRVVLPSPPERQGEAIAFSADGRAYLTVSEGGNPSVFICLADDACFPDG